MPLLAIRSDIPFPQRAKLTQGSSVLRVADHPRPRSRQRTGRQEAPPIQPKSGSPQAGRGDLRHAPASRDQECGRPDPARVAYGQCASARS